MSEFQLPLPHSMELLRRLRTAAGGTAAGGTVSLWRHHTAVRQSHSHRRNGSGTSFTDRLSAQCCISFQLGFPYPFCFSWEVSGFSPLENLPWGWRGPEEVLVGCKYIDLNFSSAALGPPLPTDPPFRTHFTLKPHRAGKGDGKENIPTRSLSMWVHFHSKSETERPGPSEQSTVPLLFRHKAKNHR